MEAMKSAFSGSLAVVEEATWSPGPLAPVLWRVLGTGWPRRRTTPGVRTARKALTLGCVVLPRDDLFGGQF